ARFDDDVRKLPTAALEGKATVGGPGRAQEIQGLIEACRRLFNSDAKTVEFGGPVAFADAEIQPAIAEKIERRHLLGEQDRIVPRQHHHSGAKAQALGASSQVAQEVE